MVAGIWCCTRSFALRRRTTAIVPLRFILKRFHTMTFHDGPSIARPLPLASCFQLCWICIMFSVLLISFSTYTSPCLQYPNIPLFNALPSICMACHLSRAIDHRRWLSTHAKTENVRNRSIDPENQIQIPTRRRGVSLSMVCRFKRRMWSLL